MSLPGPGSPPARGRTHRLRRTLVVGALIVFVTGIVTLGTFTYRWLTGPTCRVSAGGQSFGFTPEQTRNAATITAIAMKRGLPARAATIALATAIQESGLRNIAHGDRDSLGLFQQRPSQGWGSAEQVQDPVYATNAFYDALVKIDGYAEMEITVVAQAVQRSAYPSAYADHEGQGRVLASTLSGHSPAGLGCRLPGAPDGSDAAHLAEDLRTETGRTGTVDADARVTVHTADAQSAWGVAAWAVAGAEAYGVREVTVADRAWRRDRGRNALDWVATDAAATGTTVTISLG